MKQSEVKFPRVVTAFELIGLLAIFVGVFVVAIGIDSLVGSHGSSEGGALPWGLAASIGGMFFLAIAECLIKLCQIEAHLRRSGGDAE
jgi:hypothetical protein